MPPNLVSEIGSKWFGFLVSIHLFGYSFFGWWLIRKILVNLSVCLVSDWCRQCHSRQGQTASRRSEGGTEDGAGVEQDEEGSGAVPRVVSRSDPDTEETFL